MVQVPTYIGEMGQNMHTRGKEHLQSLQRRDSTSALWKHCDFAYKGDCNTPFSMQLISKHRDPLGHLIAEEVLINHQRPGETLNSHLEWCQPRVVRVAFLRNLPVCQAQLGGDNVPAPTQGPKGNRQGTQTAPHSSCPHWPPGTHPT